MKRWLWRRRRRGSGRRSASRRRGGRGRRAVGRRIGDGDKKGKVGFWGSRARDLATETVNANRPIVMLVQTFCHDRITL